MQISAVIENVGPTGTCAPIALVVDLASSVYDNSASANRGPSKNEVLQALETFKAYILADTWPPA